MEREILFRGKRTGNGERVEGHLIVFPKSKITKIMVWNMADIDFDAIEVRPETVGQYTGLTDKNGKKIFEGDIVRLPELFGSEIATIEYLGSAFKAKSSSFCYQICESMVVLGNIHDNPELLNGEES